MPAGNESRYPEDWLRVAARDFERVAKRLAEGDVEDAAFRLQQAIEKYLKGFLLSRGWSLKRLHDLNVLLTDAVRYHSELERYRTLCQQVTNWYVVERYPAFEEGPSMAEVRQAYRQARTLVRQLQAHRMKPSHR